MQPQNTSEVRVCVPTETLAVIDGMCAATGQTRTGVINDVLGRWAENELHKATLICRVAGVNPAQPEYDRRTSDRRA